MKKYLIGALFGAISAFIIGNYMNIKFIRIVDGDWLNFWSNVIGASIGVLGAYTVANWQINKNRENSKFDSLQTNINNYISTIDRQLLKITWTENLNADNFIVLNEHLDKVEILCDTICDIFKEKLNAYTKLSDELRNCNRDIIEMTSPQHGEIDYQILNDKLLDQIEFFNQLNSLINRRK